MARTVPKAIARARERAQAAGVQVQFVQGDVTPASGFVVHIECFNYLNDAQRKAVGREVSAVAAPEATMLILAWAPGGDGRCRRVRAAVTLRRPSPGWNVIDEDAFAAKSTLPWWLRNADLRFWRLRRLPQSASEPDDATDDEGDIRRGLL